MDQDTLVNADFDGGWQLISAMSGHGFKIDVAFWARLSGEQKWVLYISSPTVNERGLRESYQLVYSILRDAPEWGLDPFRVSVFASGNPMAQEAAELAKRKGAMATPLVTNTNPGVIRFNGSSLGRVWVDGAFIYSHLPETVSA